MMKTFKSLFTAFVFTFAMANVQGQCTGDSWNFDEDDFMAGSIEVVGNGAAGPMMTDQIDVNGDGTLDIQITYYAEVNNSTNGSTHIQAGWGGVPVSGTAVNAGSSDFGGETTDDAPGAEGHIIMVVDYLNGFNSDAANFELDWSSINGSSEAYEYGFGFVSAGTDASGAPLTGLSSLADLSDATTGIAQYSATDYDLLGAGFVPISEFVLGAGAVGAFDNQGDDMTSTAPLQSGVEEPNTGSGANSSGDSGTGISTLNPTDLITQVIFVYGVSNATFGDADGDGLTSVNSPPSGSFSGISGCFAEACAVTGDVAFTESCGTYTIDVTNVDETGASGTGFSIEYSTDGGATWIAYTAGDLLAADSAALLVQLVDAADATCTNTVFDGNAPTGSVPNVPVFVPNGATTTN